MGLQAEEPIGRKKVLVAQSGPILCDPMDCSLPGSFVQGIFQARILEWVDISFSNKRKLYGNSFNKQKLQKIHEDIDRDTAKSNGEEIRSVQLKLSIT